LSRIYCIKAKQSEKSFDFNNILELGDLLVSIRKKFIFIYLLNVSDIIFTLLLLQTGSFVEGNFFMRGVVQSGFLSLAIKMGIPAMLIYFISIRIKSATERQLVIGNRLINACLTLYAAINLSHVFWIILYNTYIV
jgi:hypothetical protein